MQSMEGEHTVRASGRKRISPLVVVLGVIAALWVIGSVPAANTAVPRNTSAPTIRGTAEVGQTLTANKGTWSGTSPISYQYQWRRCDEQGASCSPIDGADDQSYALKQVDSGNTLRVRVVARNAEGSDTRVTAQTAVVKAPSATPPPPSPPPPPSGGSGCQGAGGTVQISGLAPPERLNVDRADSSPAVVGGSTDQVTLSVRVSACNGKPVQGALVFVTATPYNQFSVPPEATTGANGIAEVTMNRLRGYPASQRQRLLVLFIRARKQGENLLGGISSRRLVSIPVDLSR